MHTQEIRTPEHKLLIFKINSIDPNRIQLELKNGKREESITLETFIARLNECLEGSQLKLHIVST